MKVLVVDDSKSIRMLVSQSLAELGHEVIQADTGNAALDCIETNDIDLIMMDVEMPGMNGFETTRAIRSLRGSDDWFPIIFLTTKIDDDSYAAGIDVGGDAYLTKPITPRRLEKQIVAMERIYDMRQKLNAVRSELLKANEALSHASLHDQLTGLANRRHFDVAIHREFRHAKREKEPLTLILCDIDFFKVYNDMNGHMAGDECLKIVAKAIGSVPTRATDLACRYGGEEFAVILPNSDWQGGKLVGEKIREAVLDTKSAHPGSKVHAYVTLSLGLATYNGQYQSIEEMKQAADDALYLAKENGRNRLESA